MILLNFQTIFGQEEILSSVTSVADELISKQPQKDPWDYYVTIIGISIATGGLVISAYFTTKALKSSKRKTEADLFLRLNETLYRSNEAKEIIDAAVHRRPILKENGGITEKRDLENFLNEVQAVCILINHEILSPEFAEPGFVWVVHRMKENKEIMDYIKNAQNTFGYYSWGEISMYDIKRFKRATAYERSINFNCKENNS